MPAFARVNGEWVGGDLRTRTDGGWTDERDNAFGCLDSAWVQVQPEPLDFLPPINLAADPASNDVTLTWDDPTQDLVPTHVQIRIPEITPIWTEYIYGTQTATFSALNDTTPYQGQVRYVIRSTDNGQVINTSATATVFFTTLALAGPGDPAPDPGGTGNDSIVTWPFPQGTPGPVGGTDCWWEYVIQEFAYDTGFTDTLVTAEVDGDIGDLAFNFIDEGFACGDVLRWKYREVCNSVPGDWEYAAAFSVICDYTDACGGAAQTTAFTDNALYSDADIVFAMPKMCWNNDTFENEIIDFVAADVEYGKLSAYNLPLRIDDAWGLYAKSGLSVYGEPLVAGRVPGLVPIGSPVPGLQSDFTFTFDVFLDIVPQGGSGAPVKLIEIGKTCKVYAYADGASWNVTVSIPKEGGGTFDLTSTMDLTTDEWHKITVTIDQDGDKILYIDGVADITDADTTRADFADFTSEVELYVNDNGAHRLVAGWGRVLDASEVGLLNAPPYPYYINDSLVAIGSGQTSFAHTLRSGILAGDMLLVFWKTNETTSDKVWGALPAGWTEGIKNNGNAIWWKIADGSETTVTASWTGTSDATAAVQSLVYRNVDPTTPFEGPFGLVDSGSSTTSAQAADTTPRCALDADGFTSYFEGMSYVGIVWANTTTLDTGATRQPNLLERKATAGTREWNHFSSEGITENGLLINNNRARWTHASSPNGCFAVCLRAPRTVEWLAKPHVAFWHADYKTAGSASNLLVNPTMDHLDGLLCVLALTNANENSVNQAFDVGDPVNTWLTKVSPRIYYGDYAQANQAKTTENGLVNIYVIANANQSDPFSMQMMRASYPTYTGYPRRFWFRDGQLVIGTIRTSQSEAAPFVVGSDGDIIVEYQGVEIDTTAGTQSGQTILARATVAGEGVLPTITPNTDWDGHSIAWMGINHSTESAPSLLTPSIVGSPTIVTGAAGARTINKPSGAAVGDILLMVSAFQTGGRISANFPAGFEMLNGRNSGAGGTAELEFYTKLVDGTEPSSWTPTFSTNGMLAMILVRNILPIYPVGKYAEDVAGTLANPEPMPTGTTFFPGIVIRSGGVQKSGSNDVDIDVGTKIVANADVPWSTVLHLEVTGEVIAGTTIGAANFSLTPYAAEVVRNYVYHLDAMPDT